MLKRYMEARIFGCLPLPACLVYAKSLVSVWELQQKLLKWQANCQVKELSNFFNPAALGNAAYA